MQEPINRQEKVSRDELRNMRVGQSRIFLLIDNKKVESARVQSLQLNTLEGLTFDFFPDYDLSAVCFVRRK